MNETTTSKAALREDLLQQRMKIPPAARLAAAEAVCENFLANVPLPAESVIAGYWPIRNEIDDRILLRRLLQMGFTCALPCVDTPGSPLVFRQWSETARMVGGNYSIPEPREEAVVTPTIVLVPMAAFDSHRSRLGYGSGYYDRTLGALKGRQKVVAVGLAYDTQLYPLLPQEENDVSMDMIITDKKVY